MTDRPIDQPIEILGMRVDAYECVCRVSDPDPDPDPQDPHVFGLPGSGSA